MPVWRRRNCAGSGCSAGFVFSRHPSSSNVTCRLSATPFQEAVERIRQARFQMLDRCAADARRPSAAGGRRRGPSWRRPPVCRAANLKISPSISRGACWWNLPEHTHEGDLVREAQPIVGAPPQGDLSSVGLEEGGIADQAGAGDIGIGDRHGFCQEQTPVLAEQFSSIDEFIEATASRQASEKRRRLDELTSVLQRGDRLVSELSRLGRSLGRS